MEAVSYGGVWMHLVYVVVLFYIFQVYHAVKEGTGFMEALTWPKNLFK